MNIVGKRGSWVNQFAVPNEIGFKSRADDVDYVIIKYGLRNVEQWAFEMGKPWLAERMGEEGAGTQNGPANALKYARELAIQANQPGCVGAVINLEEADGGWHTDDGWATLKLVTEFRRLAPGKPLYASLDTRGNRPNYPYQRACAAVCDGLMPMIYPKAFGQQAGVAFSAALTPLVRNKWAGKPIMATYQTYDNADVPSQVFTAQNLYNAGVILGANSYTLGHATDLQWWESQRLVFADPAPPLPTNPDMANALIAIAKLWTDTWTAIALRGTIEEASQLARFWEGLLGK